MNLRLALAIWCAGLAAASQFAKMSVLYPQIRELFPDRSGVEIGFLLSTLGIVGLIFGTTAGAMVTRIGPRRAMLSALALAAAISLFQATLPSYGIILLTRIPEGVAHLVIVVVGPTAMAATAGPARQGLAMTLWGTFFGVTFTAFAYIGPTLAAAQGIGAVFLLHAVLCLACLAGLARLMPADPPRGRDRVMPDGLWRLHRDTYASPFVAAPAMGFVCYTVTYVAALTLLPDAVDPAWGRVVAVSMPLVSIAVSMTLGVWLLGRMSAVRTVQAGFAAVIAASLGLWLTWGIGPAEAIFAALLAAALGIAQGASFAAIPALNPDTDARARAAGAIAQLGNLGTTTGTPALAYLLERTGVHGLALFLAGFSALGIVIHAWLARRRARA